MELYLTTCVCVCVCVSVFVCVHACICVFGNGFVCCQLHSVNDPLLFSCLIGYRGHQESLCLRHDGTTSSGIPSIGWNNPNVPVCWKRLSLGNTSKYSGRWIYPLDGSLLCFWCGLSTRMYTLSLLFSRYSARSARQSSQAYEKIHSICEKCWLLTLTSTYRHIATATIIHTLCICFNIIMICITRLFSV